MNWFNYYGLAVMAIIMIPNIVYAVKHKNDAANYYNKKAVVICEQIGRYGCFALMIFNIPHTYFNFWFDHALTVYLSVNGGLCLAYIIFWIVCRNRNGIVAFRNPVKHFSVQRNYTGLCAAYGFFPAVRGDAYTYKLQKRRSEQQQKKAYME